MGIAVMASWIGSVSGRVGDIVLVDTAYGLVARGVPKRSRDKSPLQVASRKRLAVASRAFGALTREEGQAWATFGLSLGEPHPRTGRIVGLSAQQAFNRLATKLLQIDSGAALPKLPPSEPFFGDGIRVSVTASAGGIEFAADAANREGVVTELLLQPLASLQRRTYVERYRTQAFASFAGTSPTATVPCPPGWNAAAVRFVEAATGRTTGLFEIGVVQVVG